MGGEGRRWVPYETLDRVLGRRANARGMMRSDIVKCIKKLKGGACTISKATHNNFKMLKIQIGSMTIFSSEIAGKFRDYDTFFKSKKEYIEFNRGELIATLSKNPAENCIIEKNNIIMLAKNRFEISIKSECSNMFSRFGVNGKYLISLLELYDTETIRLYSDPNNSDGDRSPVCIYGYDTQAIIMPIKI